MNCAPKQVVFRRSKPKKSHTLWRSGRTILQGQDYIELKRQAMERSGGYCESPGCNKRVFGRPENFHHIKFRSHGGSDELSNIAVLCITCHNKAHGR